MKYILLATKNLNSRVLFRSNNKSEIKKVRTQYKYQMLLPNISGEIYDTKAQIFIP